MLGVENVLAVAAAFVIVTASPGPATLAVATVSMRSGRRNGLLFGAGLSVGLGFWGVIAATGMGAALQTTAGALTVLKLIGGCYLCWLAYQSAKSAWRKYDTPARPNSEGRWFLRGLVLNLSNPKALVAWMAALSIGLGVGDGPALVIVSTLVCISLGFANYALYALAFSLSGAMAAYKRLRSWIEGAVSVLFGAAGVGLIGSSLR